MKLGALFECDRDEKECRELFIRLMSYINCKIWKYLTLLLHFTST